MTPHGRLCLAVTPAQAPLDERVLGLTLGLCAGWDWDTLYSNLRLLKTRIRHVMPMLMGKMRMQGASREGIFFLMRTSVLRNQHAYWVVMTHKTMPASAIKQ